MSTNDLNLTLVGWVATEPKLYSGPSTSPFTSFRMASTRRYFDRALNAWVDGRTEWFTVKSWRQQARNVAESLRKSDPVIVMGRLATEQWTGPEGARTTLVIEALAIGPDLTFGSAKFGRTVHLGVAADGSGQPLGDQESTIEPGGGGPPSDDGGVGHPAGAEQWATARSDDDEAELEAELEDELGGAAVGIGALSASRSIT